jgi:hypothetical protein
LFSPAGNHGVESELVHPTLCSPNPSGFINDRLRTVGLVELQKPHQQDGVLAESPLQRDLLIGLLIPLQLAILHKKILRAIPARHFYNTQACNRKAGVSKHAEPPQHGNAGQDPLAVLS